MVHLGTERGAQQHSFRLPYLQLPEKTQNQEAGTAKNTRHQLLLHNRAHVRAYSFFSHFRDRNSIKPLRLILNHAPRIADFRRKGFLVRNVPSKK